MEDTAIGDLLVQRCLAGHAEAQRQFYQKYAKAMFNTCLRMLNNSEDAEDALQDAFVLAFRNLRTFKGDAPVGAWLKRIVINTCLAELKKQKSTFLLSMAHLPERHLKAEENTNSDSLRVNAEVKRVKKALTQLPDGFRVVLSLYLFEGYNHKEIGAILGISENTSKSQYARAKKKLRQML